jgi:hypothetical protein
VKPTIRFLSDLLIEQFFMRWLEIRTRQAPRIGINVKKPWCGGFWISSKGRFDTDVAIQGRPSTREMAEKHQSCSS